MKPFSLTAATLMASLMSLTVASAQDAGTADNQDAQQNQESTEQNQGGSSEQAGAAAGQDTEEVRPLTMTCQEIIDTDVKLVPQLVYWIDGYNVAYNAQTGTADVDPIVQVRQDWLTVPVENVITACEADPSRTAADVIEEERGSAAVGTE